MQNPQLPDLAGREAFPNPPFPGKEWEITAAAFDTFLAWLDPSRDEAGRRYESIRLKLIRIFTCRCCCFPEDLADETINRVIVKVPEIAQGYSGDPARYFGGVARNVFHEYARRRAVPAPMPEPDPPESREREAECLEKCLAATSQDHRNLVVRYFAGEKGRHIRRRNELAHSLGLELNALRIRVHRIRAVLRKCVGECLAATADR